MVLLFISGRCTFELAPPLAGLSNTNGAGALRSPLVKTASPGERVLFTVLRLLDSAVARAVVEVRWRELKFRYSKDFAGFAKAPAPPDHQKRQGSQARQGGGGGNCAIPLGLQKRRAQTTRTGPWSGGRRPQAFGDFSPGGALLARSMTMCRSHGAM